MDEYMSGLKDLNRRSQDILRQIVETYLETGEPVGSRTLSQNLTNPVSAATVRNVMSDLEGLGLLFAPHTSAGRLPTDAGLRMFVDGLLELGHLSESERHKIEAQMRGADSSHGLDDILRDASQLLSGLSQCAGLVLAPKNDAVLKHIEFVPVDGTRALVVMVTEDGSVENRVIEVPPGITPSALTEATNYLNARFRGRTVSELASQLDVEILSQRQELQEITRRLIDAGVGYSTDTEERISLTWRTPRINSHGHSQETRLEYSRINPSGRVTYKIPLTHPLNDVLVLSARKEENEFGDLDSQQKELEIRRETLMDGDWIRSYSLRTLNESWDAEGLDTQSDYLLPGLTFSHKFRTGPFVDPIGGFSQYYQLEAGSEDVGSDIDLLRAYGKFIYVTTLKARHRVVTRAELGAVFVDSKDVKHLAPSLGFFAGGAQSIRGFAYQGIGNKISGVLPSGKHTTLVVGGDRLVTASMEYQYYFSEQWRGALFSDFGDAFDEGEFDANYSAGFGVHYLTIAGAIKVEVANSLSNDNPGWRLHLNIGAEF